MLYENCKKVSLFLLLIPLYLLHVLVISCASGITTIYEKVEPLPITTSICHFLYSITEHYERTRTNMWLDLFSRVRSQGSIISPPRSLKNSNSASIIGPECLSPLIYSREFPHFSSIREYICIRGFMHSGLVMEPSNKNYVSNNVSSSYNHLEHCPRFLYYHSS